MEIIKIEDKFIDELTDIAVKEYKDECCKCSQLMKADFRKDIEEILHSLCKSKYGKVAIDNGKVIGYLSFWGPWDGYFATRKGAYSPVVGNGFIGDNRGKLASLLFQAVGNDLAADGITSYAITRYAHDEEVGRSFVMNGFGIRCSDGIMKLSERRIITSAHPEISFRILKREEWKKVNQLDLGLTKHLLKAPVFFPCDIDESKERFNSDEIKLFVAEAQGRIVGFMALSEDGESFLAEKYDMLNICGCYFEKEYRGDGIPAMLLEYICRYCEEQGKEYLGVDCETLNPTALRFWGKHFENYTYSYHRIIDDRVVGYDKYLNSRIHLFDL